MILIDDISGKQKTFDNNMSVNFFLGNYSGFNYKPLNTFVYYGIKEHSPHHILFWDDGSEMTCEEWIRCARTLLTEFN